MDHQTDLLTSDYGMFMCIAQLPVASWPEGGAESCFNNFTSPYPNYQEF